MGAPPEEGYFPRGRSLLRRVHEERLVGLHYGQRALCIGALDPRNFIGTALHTRGRDAPFQRLAHTAIAFERVFFAPRREADAILERVRTLHQRVRGELPKPAGPYPAGTPYSAFDPELMLWTVAVTCDSAACFFELLVRPLEDDERDALWRDYLLFGELFGMPRSVAPTSWREFREWYETRLASDRMYLTEEARHAGLLSAFELPLPRGLAPAKRLHDALILGSLPQRVRELYGLPFGRQHRAAFTIAVALLRGTRSLAPRALTRGRCASAYELVARTERARIARGERVARLLPIS
ncbi:oxygenase MpaB family protein [Thermoleophilum album]|uniref:Uncharacterized conserved protein, DUF2236 family n=1 Tax=Thermoleophilum album TaxID=29539 RepID=A0A1H6FMT5_THEAL|nr:oxygenase MpaB family protein [Thermoleophilum album]SEH11500.1 Uncharacterized conserved protein, DUF2236 family [Thermoleophilum album]